MPPKTSDNVYDRFLRELFTIEPNVNFGVSLANKAPYVIAVNQLGSNIAMQTDSIIEQIPNVGGMIIGDFLFGEARCHCRRYVGNEKKHRRYKRGFRPKPTCKRYIQ